MEHSVGIGPEWAVIGYPLGDQYVLIASREIARGSIQVETERAFAAAAIQTRTTAVVEMESYTIFVGRSYVECWDALVRHWSPDGRPRQVTA